VQDLIRSYGEEKEARIAVESSKNELSEELNRVKLDKKRLNDQVLLLFSNLLSSLFYTRLYVLLIFYFV
jgi:hypothetical protein